MNILADASLPGLDVAFPSPFNLSTYNSPEEIPSLLTGKDVLLCRSTLKVNSALLKNSTLQYVATASSGSDHLDKVCLKEKNIQLIDAKGCNAIAVADYVISCLAYLDKNRLVKGKKAGIIGMGHVGTKVYDRLNALNFELISYDPLKENIRHTDLSALFECDIICIHAELHNNAPYPSLNLLDKTTLQMLKPGCIIINAARGGIVNEMDLLNQPSIIYCTDVYLNEPEINQLIIDRATLCTPHIAGHSIEGKYTAIELISKQLHHLKGLQPPQYVKAFLSTKADYQSQQTWQDLALSLYNPVTETSALKKAADKKSAFLSLRQQHQNRHDFPVCMNQSEVEFDRLLKRL